MNYYEDAIEQLNEVINQSINEQIKSTYEKDLKNIFLGIYAINYIASRIELKSQFSTEYFKITFSCILESFSLILNNYPRGSTLVLRSGLENFIKHIILSLDKTKQFQINDRSYTANKTTLNTILNNEYVGSMLTESQCLNSKMEALYKRLSGISHSLVKESKNNIINYFSDIDDINTINVEKALEEMTNTVEYIYGFSVIISKFSFQHWESEDVNKLLRLVFGKRKASTYMSVLKS